MCLGQPVRRAELASDFTRQQVQEKLCSSSGVNLTDARLAGDDRAAVCADSSGVGVKHHKARPAPLAQPTTEQYQAAHSQAESVQSIGQVFADPHLPYRRDSRRPTRARPPTTAQTASLCSGAVQAPRDCLQRLDV